MDIMEVSPFNGVANERIRPTQREPRRASAAAVKLHTLRLVTGNVAAEDTGLPLKN